MYSQTSKFVYVIQPNSDYVTRTMTVGETKCPHSKLDAAGGGHFWFRRSFFWWVLSLELVGEAASFFLVALVSCLEVVLSCNPLSGDDGSGM
jgi:hypothetical protein